MSGDLRETFFAECEDLLDQMGEGLRALVPNAFDGDTVNSVFRAVHSIKGGAGAFKLALLVDFAHTFETLLDEIRSENLDVTDDILRLLHHAGDQLADMVAVERDEAEQDRAAADRLIADIRAVLPRSDDGADAGMATPFVPMALTISPIVPAAAKPATFRIEVRPTDALYASGNEPALIFRELAELGTMKNRADLTGLPPIDAVEIGQSHVHWIVELVTERTEADIRTVFEFVESTCELTIERLDETHAHSPEPPPVAGHAPDPAPATAQQADGSDDPATASGKSAGPGAGGAPSPAARAAPKPTIRVDLERIDKLINIVGELIIQQAMLNQAVEEAQLASGSDVSTALDELKQLSRDIQESVMAIRAQPVKPLFDRMFRIVREASEAAGKPVQLVTEGESTEVDKTVVEKLADPLTHMVRNAIDHGLEKPERRMASGKPERGTVTLSAGHRSGRVLITVADDGGGIDRDRVRRIAADRGLIDMDANLSEADIDNLLFLPGFSTAAEVSALSGRGVGMDVVKNAIQSLGGRVTIQSAPGEGTTFSISLPLTLAVLDGMVVQLADQQMVVPITAIVETLRPRAGQVMALGHDSSVLAIRGSYVPIVDVGRVLAIRPALDDFVGRVALLIETEDGLRVAFIVDDIIDQRQVVIKSLHDNYGEVAGIAAATVFGDGRVALIIDPGDLIDEATRNGIPPVPLAAE